MAYVLCILNAKLKHKLITLVLETNCCTTSVYKRVKCVQVCTNVSSLHNNINVAPHVSVSGPNEDCFHSVKFFLKLTTWIQPLTCHCAS